MVLAFTARCARLAPVLLALGVSGCALPPALTIASYFLDAATYIATGKSPSENFLSAAVGQDCALFHVVQSKPVCVDEQDGSIMVASARAGSEDEDLAQHYVTLGTLEDGTNVERRVARLDGVALTIVATESDGRKFHRVVAGPLSQPDMAALYERLGAPDRQPAQLAELPN